jgi:DNA-binding NarL/FixJ family response regulator
VQDATQDMMDAFGRDADDVRTRIFIVDDHPLVRQSLRLLLGREADLKVCGEAATGHAALTHAPFCDPDVVLIDWSLPDMSGVALARELRRRHPRLVLAMLADRNEQPDFTEAVRSGVRGLIVRRHSAELASAVRQLMSGEDYRSAEFSRRPVRPRRPQCRPALPAAPDEPVPDVWAGRVPTASSRRLRAPRHRR